MHNDFFHSEIKNERTSNNKEISKQVDFNTMGMYNRLLLFYFPRRFTCLLILL